MQVAYYARVSTHQQQHEETIESQQRSLKQHIQHHGWSLLPEHEYTDDGIPRQMRRVRSGHGGDPPSEYL
jgi:DNA invertase Pin-like site-specific DNA recombinase